MRDSVILKRRTSLGQEEGEAPPPSPFQPLMERVGVPLLWVGLGIGIGYILASRGRKSA